MSDFKAKMHQIRFRLGLCPRPDPAGEAYSAPPDPLAGFERLTSKGGEGIEKGRGGRRRDGREEGREGEGRGGEAFLVMWPRRLSALNPPLFITVAGYVVLK